MRLICPSCSAAYEIDESAIGDAGRKVRCAACAEEWFQDPDGAPPRPDARADPSPAAAPGRIGRTDALRDDKSAPDNFKYAFKSDPADDADEDGAAPAAARAEPVTFVDETRSSTASRTEELAASLRDDDEGKGRGGAFIAGFAVIVVIALVLVGAYVKAPEIAAFAPTTSGPLTTYTDLVDQGRLMLAEAVGE